MATNVQKKTDVPAAPSMLEKLEGVLVQYLNSRGADGKAINLPAALAEAFPDATDKGRVDVMLGKLGWVDGGFDGRVKKAAVTRVRRVLVVGGKNWTAIKARVDEIKNDEHVTSGKVKLINEITDKMIDGLSLVKAEAAVDLGMKETAALAKARWDAAMAELIAAGKAYAKPDAAQKRLDKLHAEDVSTWKLVEVAESEKEEEEEEEEE